MQRSRRNTVAASLDLLRPCSESSLALDGKEVEVKLGGLS